MNTFDEYSVAPAQATSCAMRSLGVVGATRVASLERACLPERRCVCFCFRFLVRARFLVRLATCARLRAIMTLVRASGVCFLPGGTRRALRDAALARRRAPRRERRRPATVG